jgi:hypothetical protein
MHILAQHVSIKNFSQDDYPALKQIYIFTTFWDSPPIKKYW